MMKAEDAKTYEYQGELLTIVQLMKFTDLKIGCVTSRLRSGWDVEEAISTPVRPKGINAEFSKSDLDDDLSANNKRVDSAFKEHGGFAQCSRRCNAK